ncbi:MAG TPA: lysylphosphatidylglycerol synthase transmembrane domain-containing protein [Candidatus Saccharimonadales bacterium]
MSFRTWASIVTLVLLGLIIFAAWHEIERAWHLLGTVNLWILALSIPAQIFVYFVAGEMMFSYLRDKKLINHISVAEQARMALEMNFVNHTLPSAGVSGISYMTWRLHKYGVPPGRATMAQLVRFVAAFAAFITLLAVALIAITIDGNINRWIILFSSLIAFAMIGGTGLMIFLVSSPSRSEKFSGWLVRAGNRVLALVRVPAAKFRLQSSMIERFFKEMHQDYLELKREKRLLLKPFLWGLAFTAGDVLLFMITFWALGISINPAPVLIAYGLAMIAGFVMVTPGGAGAYEAIMVAFLAIAGISAGTAIAGILLTRVILLVCTIGLGYVFYQHALIKYGKRKT